MTALQLPYLLMSGRNHTDANSRYSFLSLPSSLRVGHEHCFRRGLIRVLKEVVDSKHAKFSLVE